MISALTAVLITCIGWISSPSRETIPLAQATPPQVALRASAIPAQSPPLPSISAKHAVVIDGVSLRVLGEKSSSEPALQASISKLATLLESLKENQFPIRSTERRAFSKTENRGVQSGVQTGESLSLRDAWAALLLPSANDIAEWLANAHGDRDAFLRRTVQAFGNLGVSIEMANASGLDEGTIGSTFSAQTSAELLHFTGEVPIVGDLLRTQKTIISPNGRSLSVTSTNSLLLDGYPVFAGKTGTTDAAGQNLAVWIRDETHDVLIVVLGSRDRYSDAKSLLAWTQANFSWHGQKEAERSP